jgi:very-short-patch-repair endonuclease
MRFLRHERLPRPVSQYPITLDGRNFILDFAYPDRRLAIEADGYRWHASRERFERDRDKGNELILAGWRLLRITDRHLMKRPRLAAQVRRALGQEVLL